MNQAAVHNVYHFSAGITLFIIQFAIKYFVMVQSTDFESCRFGSILVEDIIGICQKEHPKFKVLQCSSKPYWHGLKLEKAYW